MRVDNHGEGGIMALMALLAGQNKIAFGLFGAALIYGDGAITPASPRHPRSATGLFQYPLRETRLPRRKSDPIPPLRVTGCDFVALSC